MERNVNRMGTERASTGFFLKEETMLVLSRKLNESIHMGNNIVLSVLDIRGSIVRLGIDAPEDIAIRRSELPALAAVRPPPAVPHSASVPAELITGVGTKEAGACCPEKPE